MKDCHVHSDYTDRSNDSLESYVAAARAKGIDELTITELVEIIDGAPPFAFPFYKLKVKRTGESLGFKLNLGLEIGLQPGIEDKIIRPATSIGLDYVVASTNVVEGQEINKPNYFEGKNKDDVYRKYFEHELNNINGYMKYFDAYSKMDQIIRLGGDKRIDYKRYGEIIDAILETLIKNDKALEVYTGYMYGDVIPSPYHTILKRYKDLGGKFITLGSGACKADDLGRGFDCALDTIDSLGFEEIATYYRHEPEFEKVKSLRR